MSCVRACVCACVCVRHMATFQIVLVTFFGQKQLGTNLVTSSPLLSSPPHQVWASLFDARGQEHLLGAAAAERSQQAVLSDAEWISGSGNHHPP